jgi:adenylate cyclase
MGEHLDRQLVAVMFADMVGFTALMQEDEHHALQARAKYASVLNAQHEAFGGRIVQYYGDGALTIFPNSLDAVLCAIEIQKELSQPPDVPVRIGIHVGNVIVEPTGLIGAHEQFARRGARIDHHGVTNLARAGIRASAVGASASGA